MASIMRGTTPTLSVAVDTDLSSWPTIYLSLYGAGSNLDLDKDRLTVTKTATGCTLTATLTQAETLAFTDGQLAQVQVRAKSADGSAIATEIGTVNVRGILKDGAI